MSDLLQLQSVTYGTVVPRTQAVSQTLKKIAEGMEFSVGETKPKSLVFGQLLPGGSGRPVYVASFHFDEFPNLDKPGRPLVLCHLHLDSAPKTPPPAPLVSRRKKGITVGWLFGLLDEAFSTDTKVLIDATLTARKSFSVPPSLLATKLVAPALTTKGSGKLEVVGTAYRSTSLTIEKGGLWELQWSQLASEEFEFNVKYGETWQKGVDDPWKLQARHATEHVRQLG